MAGEADAADPTELAGVAEMHTEAAHAWSSDDADEDYPLTGSWEDPDRRWTARRVTVLAVAASVVAIGAVGGLAAWKLRDQDRSGAPDKLMVVVATTTTVVAADSPPPPKPTARAAPPSAAQMIPPPPPAPAPQLHLTDLDLAFMQKVRQEGFTGSTTDLIKGAAKVCYDLRHGHDLPEISQDMAATNDLTLSQAHIFASEVFLTYPTCHS